MARLTVDIDREKLRTWLTVKGLTMVEVSERMGASRAYLGNIINGQANMSNTAYKALCAALEVPENTFKKQPPAIIQGELLEAEPPEQLNEICKHLAEISEKLDKLLELWR